MARFGLLPVFGAASLMVLLACGLGAATGTSATPTVGSPAPDKFSIVRLTVSDGELHTLLASEARKAKAAGRHPFVEFYADWCAPCNHLRDSLGDPRMIDAFTNTYIIQLNSDDWQSSLGRSGFKVVGIPAFFEIDDQGNPTGRTLTGAAWGEDIPQNMAPPLKAFFSGSAS